MRGRKPYNTEDMRYYSKQFLVALAALAMAGCASARKAYAPKAELLKPRYGCTGCPTPPFAARYEPGGKQLTYIAALHESGTGSRTFRLIREEFDRLKPQLVIVEGIPRNAGEDNPAFISVARQNAGVMESYYVVSLALGAKASFAGGEPSPQDTKTRLLSAGYNGKDIFGHGVVQEIPVRKQQAPSAGLDDSYMEISENLTRMYRLGESSIMPEAEFIKWYEQKNGKRFDYNAVTPQETAPYNNPDSLFTQKMGFEIMKVRDTAICAAIAEALNKYDRVLVVYGAGHFGMEQDILSDMLGQPTFEAQSKGSAR